MNDHLILWIYIILLLAGGLMGFIKAQSKISLIASVSFAALLVLFALDVFLFRYHGAVLVMLLILFRRAPGQDQEIHAQRFDVDFDRPGFGIALSLLANRSGLSRVSGAIAMPTSLPIWQIHSEIIGTLRSGNRLVLVAPTGSGKTTQVPQMLLDAGLAEAAAPHSALRTPHSKKIVVLQPRRGGSPHRRRSRGLGTQWTVGQ